MNTKRHKKKILVIVHDAGGAEVIGAYLRRQAARLPFRAYGGGPALAVFKRLKLPIARIGPSREEMDALVRAHADARLVIVGAPGWMTATEINALEAAKHAGLKTAIYMDSWVDERARFGYPKKGWQRRLPDEFWAGDRYVLTRLAEKIPSVPVRSVPNQYFKDQKMRFRELRKRVGVRDEVLFVGTTGAGSPATLAALLRVAHEHGFRVRVRLHPAEPRYRYDAMLAAAPKGTRVSISHQRDLVADLARARIVVGTETMALAIAHLCGVRAVSVLGAGVRPMLPFPGIERVRSAVHLRTRLRALI